jgi:hypothetical protein
MRTVSPHDVCDILLEVQKRTGKSDAAIVRETGLHKETWRNIKRRRHATTAAVFIEFFQRYAEVRAVVDEHLDLKSKQQQTKVHSPHVSPSVASTQGAPIRL